MSHIIKYQDEVKNYLTKNIRTRDDDRYLTALILYRYFKLKKIDLNAITGLDLLKKFSELTDFPNLESIRRIRQKLQEEHSELRGELYEKRQSLQKPVQEDLGYYSDNDQDELPFN